ncbi:Uma2 family endonuclease [Nodosilinea sp. LEGE 07088]|uniref:Uma2 family endonuclease n=1 Tax=Nodosilinea sp. LEGE 07088 TaxID=2777968 RepID=UPI0018814EC9|nr:Uma2 family endonuclease [Nodosilinea sp. LEGE 07088]MBE9140541.1 Uma2 family endonuclease [Nodosilinea sp. LEGE 07088]
MTLTTSQTKPYTAEEYLALEVVSDLRHEYRHGEIIPMTGGTPAHNEITRMLVFLLTADLRKQPYSIFVTDQRLWIPDLDQYTYPDIMVTPRPPELKPDRRDTVINPILLAEVLSDSTEKYDSPSETLCDRGDKFEAYRTISTVQEYLLIAQDKPHVEQYVKQAENQWLFTEYHDLSATFKLQSVGVAISLADLYEAGFSE